jgi:magnesium-transporting ATPase (P-type)
MIKEEVKINKQLPENKETSVIVSFPDKLEIQMVQANELQHYEIFQWLATLFASIASGFWTAFFTLDMLNSFLWIATICTLVFFLFVALAYFYRKKVFYGSVNKSIYLKELK